jgi:ATP-dependent Clp protease ATP-binding subunit ClpA
MSHNIQLVVNSVKDKIDKLNPTQIKISLAVANAIVKGESVANIKSLLTEAVEQKYNVTLSTDDIKVIVEAAEWIAYLYLTSNKKFYISSDNKLYVRNVL